MVLSLHQPSSQLEKPGAPTNQQTKNTHNQIKQMQHDTLMEQKNQRVGETTTTASASDLSTLSSPSKSNNHFEGSYIASSKRRMFLFFHRFYGGATSSGSLIRFNGIVSKVMLVLLVVSVGLILCMVSSQTIVLPQVTVISTTTTTTTTTTITKDAMDDFIKDETTTTNSNGQQQLRETADHSINDVTSNYDLIDTSHDTDVNEISRSSRKIRQISILGERNSGTRWTFDHISECFNHSVEVHRRLTRYKHWFQYDNSSDYLHDTLVLAQFRNPYEWLKAMEHVPHHSPAHLRTALETDSDDVKNQTKSSSNDWKTFLSKPWTMERVGLDLEMPHDNHTLCQEHFYYPDIISCHIEPLPRTYYNWTLRYSENEPFYEMRNDGSGLPYDNIMEMRTDKIRNFLSVKSYEGVADVWAIQYEYLLADGTRHLLDRISQYTGIPYNCEPKESQLDRKPKQSRLIVQDMAHYIRTHLNWTAEEMIGYHPELKREEPFPEW